MASLLVEYLLLRVMKAFVVEYLQQRLFVRVVVDLANRLPQVKQETLDKEHGPELGACLAPISDRFSFFGKLAQLKYGWFGSIVV